MGEFYNNVHINHGFGKHQNIFWVMFLQKMILNHNIWCQGLCICGVAHHRISHVQNIIFNVFNLKTSFGIHDFPYKITPQPSRT
jgi:hypothetical protein